MSIHSNPIRWPQLILSILICQAAGGIGSLFTVASVNTWYQTLNKPALNPPAAVFGPVWTFLFLLMGISLYLIWWHRASDSPIDQDRKSTLTWFFIQLALNVLWSVCFFFLKNPALAFGEIVLLWLAIAATIFYSTKVNKVAAILLSPYIAWVSFAAYLNFAIWQLN